MRPKIYAMIPARIVSQRLKYKKIGNPIQMVFKELMNSSYGKSYLKPIDSDSYYI